MILIAPTFDLTRLVDTRWGLVKVTIDGEVRKPLEQTGARRRAYRVEVGNHHLRLANLRGEFWSGDVEVAHRRPALLRVIFGPGLTSWQIDLNGDLLDASAYY